MWMCECDWLSMKPVHTCPGAAAVLFQKGFCAFLGPVQVQIQAKICTWISEQKHTGPQTANPALQLFFPPFWIKALCKHPHQCNMVSQNPCYSYLWQTACPVTGSRKKRKKKKLHSLARWTGNKMLQGRPSDKTVNRNDRLHHMGHYLYCSKHTLFHVKLHVRAWLKRASLPLQKKK